MHSPSTRRTRCWSLLAAAVVWATAGPAGAVTIYDNFGPGDSYGSSAYGFNTVFRDGAVSFEVGASDAPFILDSIELALCENASIYRAGGVAEGPLADAVSLMKERTFLSGGDFEIRQAEASGNCLVARWPTRS